MLLMVSVFTACVQEIDLSLLHGVEDNEIADLDPNRYNETLVVDWNTIEDIWLGVGDELPSSEENKQAHDILFTIYIEEFRPRIEQYHQKDSILSLEVEYLFGVVLRSLNNKHRLSRKSRKKQLEKLRIKLQTLIDMSL